MAMLRDTARSRSANMPVTLIVKRPDGTEFTRFTHALQASGALYQPIDLPKSSRRGRWSVDAHIDPKAPRSAASNSRSRIRAGEAQGRADADQPILRPGQVNSFAVSADFLYGAPASGLTVEADMRVTVDDQPFADFGKILVRLGEASARSSSRLSSHSRRPRPTRRQVAPRMGRRQVKDTVLPLRAQLQARVFEPGGGRATRADKTVPMRTRNVYLGIRPTFEGRYAREGAETEFDIVAVDAAGQAGRPPSGRIPHRAHRL